MKLKNLRPQDYASYTCQVSVRNVCGIPDKAITFQLTNTTGTGASPPTPTWTHAASPHARLLPPTPNIRFWVFLVPARASQTHPAQVSLFPHLPLL